VSGKYAVGSGCRIWLEAAFNGAVPVADAALAAQALREGRGSPPRHTEVRDLETIPDVARSPHHSTCLQCPLP